MKTNTIKATQALIMLFATLIMAACAQKKGFTYSEAEATKQDIVTSVTATDTGVVFSELSPRPHDTGMVTLSHSTNLSEFELHLRAVLGLPIHDIKLEHAGASAVVLADKDYDCPPEYNLRDVLSEENTRIRIFGKPDAHKGRRMAVVLAYGPLSEGTDGLRDKAKRLADTVL